jgi:hypothetical protein
MDIDKGLMADMTPDEREALSGKQAQPPVPDTPETDDDGSMPENAGAESTDTASLPAAGSEKSAAETPAAEVAEAAAPAAPPTLPTYEAPAEDFAAKRAELDKAADETFKKWSQGDIDDAEYQAENRRIQGQLMDVVRAEAEASTLKRINEANAKAAATAKIEAENAALQAINAASVKAGHIDYTKDAKAAQTFDALLSIARNDPENAGKSFADIAAAVHADVLKMRGLSAPAKAPAPPAPAPRPQIPPTLGNMPAAAANTTRDSLDEALATTTDPDEAEALWARQSPQQRKQALRQTIAR